MINKIVIIGFIFIQLVSHAQNYDAELVSQVAEIKVNNDKLIKTFYFEIKINTRAGDKYSQIAIPYSKISKVSKIKAHIKDSRGEIVNKLKKSEITERSSISSFSFYEDNYLKEFTLKHNTYPYSIIYSYQIQESEFIYIDYWIPIIDSEIPTHKATLNISTPYNYPISYSNRFTNSPTIDSLESIIKYTWEAKYIDIVKPEIFSPPTINFLPAAIIVPQNYLFELNGSLKSWTNYGDWQYDLLQDLNELPDKEKNKIISLIEGIDDDKEKIRILFHYLQDETRYINISIETGGLKPYPASYVVENRYGDCKALTNYFKSILDFIEIKSFYTKVYAGNPIKEINKEFPSQQFNHVILFIPFINDSIWLDCTSDGAFNSLGTFTQNRYAFVIDKNKSYFTKTPSLMYKDVLESREITIFNDQYQGSRVSFSNNYKGEIFEILLELKQHFNKNDRLQIIRNKLIEDGFELTSYNIYRSHRDSHQINLSYEATGGKIYEKYGDEVLVHNMPLNLPQFEKPNNRKLPIKINYPIYKIDTLNYEIPSGLVLSNNLINQSITNSFGKYTLDFKIFDKTVRVIKSIIIYAGSYSIIEYNDFYKFINDIERLENKTHIVLSKQHSK